ncbi:MAG: hypothetical protein KAS32_09920 [Candidatus Peribacteraceae bacterium]|nr:hypothetical protein [Candidatus Peribacteraceae bacterium]
MTISPTNVFGSGNAWSVPPEVILSGGSDTFLLPSDFLLGDGRVFYGTFPETNTVTNPTLNGLIITSGNGTSPGSIIDAGFIEVGLQYKLVKYINEYQFIPSVAPHTRLMGGDVQIAAGDGNEESIPIISVSPNILSAIQLTDTTVKFPAGTYLASWAFRHGNESQSVQKDYSRLFCFVNDVEVSRYPEWNAHYSDYRTIDYGSALAYYGLKFTVADGDSVSFKVYSQYGHAIAGYIDTNYIDVFRR